MQVPLEIAVRNLDLPKRAEAEIRDRAAKLETLYDRLMSCRVAVEVPHRHQRTGTSYSVRIDLTVPGSELVVRRQPAKSLFTAIQSAFAAAERRLRDHAARRRGDVKLHEAQPRATVRELYPLGGYGFLETADGDTIYFDARSVVNGGFARLAVGAAVRYVSEAGEKGLQASTVVPLR